MKSVMQSQLAPAYPVPAAITRTCYTCVLSAQKHNDLHPLDQLRDIRTIT
jgi:hypothetical protein